MWPVGGASVPRKSLDVRFNCGRQNRNAQLNSVLVLLIGVEFSNEKLKPTSGTNSRVARIQSAHALHTSTGTYVNGGGSRGD